MPSGPTVATYFNLLDRWRHFPSYRLEPHVDAFLALYLADVLAAHFDVDIDTGIIPEFPLRLGTLAGGDDDGPNMSKHVDFVALSANTDTVYFVEVKTDQASRSQGQDDYLKVAKKTGLEALLGGLLRIAAATTHHLKYGRLLVLLADLGLFDVPCALQEGGLPHRKLARTELLSQVSVSEKAKRMSIEIVYVQPSNPHSETEVIDFPMFASVIEGRGELGGLLAKMLMRWREGPGQCSDEVGAT